MELSNFEKLYFVTSKTDDTVLLAMDVGTNLADTTIRWFDSVKERIMEIEEILDFNPLHFMFKRKSDMHEVYTFIPLTLDLYNAHVKENTLFKKSFEKEDEMISAILETKDNAW